MNASADPVADDLLQRLPRSPDAYPQKLDVVGGSVLLIQFDANAYRAASFLDDRILSASSRGAWVPVGDVFSAAQRIANALPLHFIFHTGHVGSTLVSRLLDETGSILSLREPLPLRTLADACDVLGRPESLLSEGQFESLLTLLARLWCRGYGATQAVTVKATSSTGRLATRVLLLAQASRAIYMNLRAEPYLATLLAGQNSPIDLRGHGPSRMRRLQSRVSAEVAPLHAMSLGELAAMSWLVESWSQHEAIERMAGRVIAIDFDEFLASIEESMRRIVGHFSLHVDERWLSGIGGSPVLSRYSKAPEHGYTPGVRVEVLAESRRYNGEEIAKGMRWIEHLARSDSAVAALVDSTQAPSARPAVRRALATPSGGGETK